MIEADGNDANGGVFSLPVTHSLLTCPPAEVKPIILKKFGSWNEGVENIAKYPIYSTSKNGVFLTASSDVSICSSYNDMVYVYYRDVNPISTRGGGGGGLRHSVSFFLITL